MIFCHAQMSRIVTFFSSLGTAPWSMFMTPCANVGSKPWYRCGCTDDTPCHLGDAGSMTFFPWFVPRTEQPVQLREVGRNRGHLLTENCSDVHLHVCRYRTGDDDCCCCSVGSRRQNITACCTGVIFAPVSYTHLTLPTICSV